MARPEETRRPSPQSSSTGRLRVACCGSHQHYISDKIDSYRDTDVRSVLSPLAKMAEETGISIIGIRHYKKGGDGPLSELGAGSIAYANVARAVHAIVPDADDAMIEHLKRSGTEFDSVTLGGDRSSVLLPVILNIAASPRPVGFKIVPDGLRAKFVWNGTRDYNADEYIESMKKKKSIGSTRHERKLVQIEEYIMEPEAEDLSDKEVAEKFGVPEGLVELMRYRLLSGESKY